ncbi:MAG TPA: hypothetical protein VK524_08045 [Polyangiaceae bacterium]|nr:hypothetical protein [Polyangiaceae bacterium]
MLRSITVIAGLIAAGVGCSEPAARPATSEPRAGRRVAPPGVCTTAASTHEPCNDDPNPCAIDSGFPGDEFCLPPPPPELGVQIHLGPKDYRDAAEVNRYLLEAGKEVNVLGVADVPTREDHFFDFVQLRMRPGSHHLINRVIERVPSEGFISTMPCPAELLSAYFVGAQSLARDDPARGIVAPENEGLGRVLPGNASLCMNQHAFNFGAEPILREVWINVYYMDPREVTQQENRIVLNADVGEIPPGARSAASASADILGAGRILNLYGHRHSFTERFAVWHNDTLIYDSHDWYESAVYEFNSVTRNPAVAPERGMDGAASGPLEVEDGDRLRIQCDIHNTSETTLCFSNEIYTGEMCILFGATIGAQVDSPGLPL